MAVLTAVFFVVALGIGKAPARAQALASASFLALFR
jgi:hypothetical protein